MMYSRIALRILILISLTVSTLCSQVSNDTLYLKSNYIGQDSSLSMLLISVDSNFLNQPLDIELRVLNIENIFSNHRRLRSN